MAKPNLSQAGLDTGRPTIAVLVAWDDSADSGNGDFVIVEADPSGKLATTATVATGDAPATGTITSVNDAAADTTILAANASRKGVSIYNDSTVVLYLALANVTSSTTVYTVQLAPNAYYELPVCDGGVYTGVLKGIWASDGSGAARVTEWT